MTTPDEPVAPDAGEPDAQAPAAPKRRARRRTSRAKDARATQRLFSPARRWEKSPAGVVGLVAFLWGMSLLVQEWLRTTWLEPRGLSASILAAPFFAAAVAGALVAVRARVAGRPALGGPAVHRFGIASGLVGATALVLALWMGPRLLSLQESARHARARAQLQDLAVALELHHRDAGQYPEGAGAGALQALDAAFRGRAPLQDPWGHDLEYRSLAGGRGYLLLSLGRDGVADVPLTEYLDESRRQYGGNDIVMVNGWFRGEEPAEDGAPEPQEIDPVPDLLSPPALVAEPVLPSPAATAASAPAPSSSAPASAPATASAPAGASASAASAPAASAARPAASAPAARPAPSTAGAIVPAPAPPSAPAPAPPRASAPARPVNRPNGPAESP